jgi:hypothetical protein
MPEFSIFSYESLTGLSFLFPLLLKSWSKKLRCYEGDCFWSRYCTMESLTDYECTLPVSDFDFLY